VRRRIRLRWANSIFDFLPTATRFGIKNVSLTADGAYGLANSLAWLVPERPELIASGNEAHGDRLQRCERHLVEPPPDWATPSAQAVSARSAWATLISAALAEDYSRRGPFRAS
jgi:hypothetical protein